MLLERVFFQFLVACTGKLDLRSHAKKVFDWEGNEITDLDDSKCFVLWFNLLLAGSSLGCVHGINDYS